MQENNENNSTRESECLQRTDSTRKNQMLQEDNQNSASRNNLLQKEETLRELEEEVAMHVKSQNRQLHELQKLVEVLDAKVNEMHKKQYEQHELASMQHDFEQHKQRLQDFLAYLELHGQKLEELQERLELQQQKDEQELLKILNLYEQRLREGYNSMELQEQPESQEEAYLQKCLELQEQQEYLQEEVLHCINLVVRMKGCLISMKEDLEEGWENVRLDLIVIPLLNQECERLRRRLELWRRHEERLEQHTRMLGKELKKLLEQYYKKHPKQ